MPAVLLIVAGVGLAVVGLCARSGRLPLNPLVGIRTTATMASEEAWYAAHRKAAWSFFVGAGIAVAGGAFALQERHEPTRTAWILMSGVFLVGVLAWGGVEGNRAARSAEARRR